MKLLWFHLMPYTRLPEDFARTHPSVWVDIDSRLFDPTAAHGMYNGDAPAARLTLASGAVEPVGVKGGAHMSSASAGGLVSDVVGHLSLWVSPLRGAGPPFQVFAFEDPDIRIDYPVWSPDGRWILFDRLKPEGGDIWLLERAAQD